MNENTIFYISQCQCECDLHDDSIEPVKVAELSKAHTPQEWFSALPEVEQGAVRDIADRVYYTTKDAYRELSRPQREELAFPFPRRKLAILLFSLFLENLKER